MRKILSWVCLLLVVGWAAMDMFIAERVNPLESWLIQEGFTDLQGLAVEFSGLALLLGLSHVLYPRKR